jgi:hypothetical protein
MADHTYSKAGLGAIYPDGGFDTTWQRSEALITPERLVRRHLFGIPLVSGSKDPRTGKADVMTPDDIIDHIDRAVGTLELETGLIIFPTQYKAKLPYDRCEYQSFGYFRIEKKPIASIELLTINLSNNQDIFSVPLDWIETAKLHVGQINIIPLTIALTKGGSSATPTTSGGGVLLALMGNAPWLASYFQIDCTLGFKDGMLPKVMNDLIGTIAAMQILSQLASTYGKSTGSSLSIDGMSQSVSSPGANIFTKRYTDLAQERAFLTKKIKVAWGTTLFTSNV